MVRKSLTISEEAYAALSRLKSRGESFTDVILKITAKTKKGSLLDYVRTMPPDEEFAETLAEIVLGSERTRVRSVRV